MKVTESKSHWAIILPIAAVVGLTAVISCWVVGWVSDDWVLRRLYKGAWFLAQRDHLSFVDGVLWRLGWIFDSPLPARYIALGCHLLTLLVVFPRVVGSIYPNWDRRTGLWLGLAVMSLSSCIEPLVWACAAPYAIVGLFLMASVAAQLAWLDDRGWAWRWMSVLALTAGLLTWDFAVAGLPLIILMSWMRCRSTMRCLRDATPHTLLLAGYLILKFSIGSLQVPATQSLVRIVGNIVYTPFLTLSPVLLGRNFLLSPLGAAIACATFAALLSATWKAKSRRVFACLVSAYMPLIPVLAASGPQQRYLYLVAPWMVLAAVATVAEAGFSARVRDGLSWLAMFLVLVSAGNQWSFAAGWKTAADLAEQTCTSIATAVAGRPAPVIVLNQPDRLPGWGPTKKFMVWRLGLAEAMESRGVRVELLAHTLPVDPERQGVVLDTPVADSTQVKQWQTEAKIVLNCRGTSTCSERAGPSASRR